MAEPEQEIDVGKLIKAGIKRIETAQAGSPSRRIADFFMALPSKKDYPDYYLFIKTPISLKEIRVSRDRDLGACQSCEVADRVHMVYRTRQRRTSTRRWKLGSVM